MKDKTAYKALESIAEYISLSRLAKSIGKGKSWLYHKMKNDIVNGVEYRFNVSEYALLAERLHKLAEDIHRCAEELDSVVQDANRTAGRYHTNENVFEYPLFKEWLKLIPELERTTILEPFAGECSILKMLEQYGFKWKCYDIEGGDNVVKRDTISNFPKNHRVCITNPPYLAKNSATRRGLQYPDCEFDNIYKYCLKLMLDNCQYVAAIIPDSFIQSGLFTDRLYGVISLPEKVFEDTEYPVCLAMFVPSKTEDFHIWNGDSVIGTYLELSKYDLSEYNDERWRFNDANGEIGIVCSDGKVNKIRFVKGDDINTEIKGSNRFLVRISGLPEGVDSENFIERCNCVLEQYRNNTKDVFLNSFKGLRSDGSYRKRIPFKVVRSILTYALNVTKQSSNAKVLLLDFDLTLFDTRADEEVRKNSTIKNRDVIYSKIPEYRLYDGWREVFETAKTKGVKIAIISTAKKELIQKTLDYFGLQCDVVIGWQRCYQKPHAHLVEMALNKLHVNKENVISVGDSIIDREMSKNGEVKFLGAIWDSQEVKELKTGETIDSPLGILKYI